MRILIVTSEPLNSRDLFSSIFEIDQARILQGHAEVEILSVGQGFSFRGIVGRFLTSSRNSIQYAFRDFLWQSARKLKRTHQHTVSGIRVCEGITRHARANGSFSERVTLFNEAALCAFDRYAGHRLPDLVHAHGRFLFAGTAALSIKRRWGVPFVYTDHSSFYSTGYAPPEAQDLLSSVLANSSAATVVSNSLADSLSKYLGKERSELGLTILPNAIDLNFESTAPRPPPTEPLTFLCVGSLYPVKDFSTAIRAFGRIRDEFDSAKLKIIGGGPLQNQLEDEIRGLNLSDRVELLGACDKATVLQEIDKCSALIVTSHTETFGVAAAEALFRGRPVISSLCGGPDEFLTDRNSLRFSVGNDLELASTLIDFSKGNKFHYQRIREEAIQLLGSATYRSRLLATYSQILSSTPQRPV